MIAKSDSDLPADDAVDQIANEMRKLPPGKLSVIRELVAFLAARPDVEFGWDNDVTDADVWRAVRPVLDECWDSPDEDAAWAHL